jgi:hypothetical protein
LNREGWKLDGDKVEVIEDISLMVKLFKLARTKRCFVSGVPLDKIITKEDISTAIEIYKKNRKLNNSFSY